MKSICILSLLSILVPGFTSCAKKSVKYSFGESSAEEVVEESPKLDYKYSSEGLIALDDVALLFQALYDIKRGRLPEAEKKLMILAEAQESEKARADFEIYYELALLKHRLGKHDEARIYAQKAEDSAKTEKQFESLYRAWMTLGESQRAVAVLEKAFDIFPQSQTIFRALIMDYLRANQKDLALKISQIYVQRNPSDISALMLYADILREFGKIEEAKKEYERIVSAGYFDESVILQLLRMYKDSGELDKALDLINANRIAESTSISLLREAVEIFLETGKYEEAVSFMKKVTEVIQEPDVLLDWVNVNFRARQYDQVISSADTVKDLLGNQEQKDLVVLMKGYSLQELKRYREAILEFEKIEEKSKFFAKAVAGKLDALREIDLEKALKFAGEISIDSPEIAHSIVFIYRNKEDYEKSLELIDEFAKRFEDKSNTFLYSKAVILYEAGRTREALDVAEELIQRNKNNPDYLNLLGYLLLEHLLEEQKNGVSLDSDKLEKAGELINQALKQKPADPYIIDSLGWFFFVKKEIELAEKYVKQALEKLPEDPAVLFHLGEIYYEKKGFEKALEVYKLASKGKPRGIEKKRIESRISEISKKLKSSRKVMNREK